jgi:hypothetical protein
MEESNKKLKNLEIERELFKKIRQSLNNKDFFLKHPIERQSSIFNFYAEQYILLGSITGTGKTSYVDHCILAMMEQILTFDPNEVHIEFLYFSMERRKRIKYAKWLSWKIFHETKLRIPSDAILNKDNTMTEDQLEYIEGYAEWLEKVLEFVDVREGAKTVPEIEAMLLEKAKSMGSYYESDDLNVYRYGEPVATFDDKYVDTKYGKKKYINITKKGETYTLYQNDRIYIPNKPTLFFVIIDHVGKVKSVGNAKKKETLDALDTVLSDARDKYGISIIAISQFNRAISSTDRLKYHQGDLDPVMEDFKDTSNMTESADLVISVFEPGRYKSWNSHGEYKGYNIRDGMVTPSGKSRARSVHFLKNSHGPSGGTQVLRFTGESMYFESLPIPEDKDGLAKIYSEVQRGL